MNFPDQLTGEKVVLAPFTQADISDEYVGWLKDPVVTRFSNQRFRTHTRDSCASYLASFAGSPNLFVSIRRRDDDKPIGTMTAYVSPPHGTADVGILIGDRAVWGKGYGQDAWNTMLDWLLTGGGMRKVTAGTLAVNAPMLTLMQRSGMAFEGRRVRQEVVDGEEVDMLYFGRFADPGA